MERLEAVYPNFAPLKNVLLVEKKLVENIVLRFTYLHNYRWFFV
jgi:hypothetical protein